MSRGTAGRRWTTLLAVLLCAGCVAPAPTPDRYVGMAEGTAAAAVSSARTAALAVQTQQRDSLTRAALEVLVQDSESALNSVTSTFESVQPPDDPAADALSRQLSDLLAEATDAARELRIAARRDDQAQLDRQARNLADTADRLDALAQELGG